METRVENDLHASIDFRASDGSGFNFVCNACMHSRLQLLSGEESMFESKFPAHQPRDECNGTRSIGFVQTGLLPKEGLQDF